MTAKLLAHIGIKRPMTPYHDHNADKVRPELIAQMAEKAVALVSDAGTPLLSDPGARVVRSALSAGFEVIPVPGPSALLAALVASGLSAERFTRVAPASPPRSGRFTRAWATARRP